MLIERGAGLSAQNEEKETPLHLALRTGQIEVAHRLIECGVDVTAETKDGETPLHQALILPYRTKVSPQIYAEVVRIILDHNPDTTAHKNGSTRFDLALRGRLAEVARTLLQHSSIPGADENMMCGSSADAERNG